MERMWVALGVVVLVGACSFTGPKGGNPGWKIFKEEHAQAGPTDPVRVRTRTPQGASSTTS